MTKKIIGIVVCLLLLTLLVPTTSEDDVVISITAGKYGKEYGRDIHIQVDNELNVSGNLIIYTWENYVFRYKRTTHAGEFILEPKQDFSMNLGIPRWGVKWYTIEVFLKGNFLNRRGLAFGNFIFFEPLPIEEVKLCIEKPYNFIYANDEELLQFPLPLVLWGELSLEIGAADEIDSVDLLIDDVLQWTDPDPPFDFGVFPNHPFSKITVKIIGHNIYGDTYSDEVTVWRLFK